MRFFLDESGSFSVPKDSRADQASVVVGVGIPETDEKPILDDFTVFVATLDRSERKEGEPKGSKLTWQSKSRFCDFVARHTALVIRPVILDLAHLANANASALNQSMSAELLRRSTAFVHEGPRQSMELLSRQFANLSTQEALRIYSNAVCIKQLLHESVLRLATSRYRPAWNDITVMIDAVRRRTASREQEVFSVLVLAWVAAWSAKDPLILVKELHDETHPFVVNFRIGGGHDLGKMLRDRIQFADSRHTPGLQIADIASNIVYRATRDLGNTENALPLFARLLVNGIQNPKYALNLFTPTEDKGGVWVQKYKPLATALAAQRAGRVKSS